MYASVYILGKYVLTLMELSLSQTLDPPTFRFDRNKATLSFAGDWISTCLTDLPDRLHAEVGDAPLHSIDLSSLGRVDTAGAYAIGRAIDTRRDFETIGGDRRGFAELTELVRPALEKSVRVPPRPRTLASLFAGIGRPVVQVGQEIYRGQVFAGQMMVALGGVLRRPRRLRLTPLIVAMEQAGLRAIPIVFVMTFFIGAVLALVGSTMLQRLGVTIYAVELVGIGVLREFGAVVAAILFSGRSASAFAAQLGSMRMNQEVDAMRVMGVDMFDALVVPRVLAAVIMLPLLTVVADLGGVTGGMLVSGTLLGIQPELFLQRLVDSVGTQQFWVGMAKVPLFAFVIAVTGCRQGLAVGTDVESLGARVTEAVVQSIFLIIMFDALFAVLFYRLDL